MFLPDERIKSYKVQGELFPPYGVPGWGIQQPLINVYVNGKITTASIGRTKPSSEFVDGRFNFEYEYPGDWFDHDRKLKGGDVIRLAWVAALIGSDGTKASVYGQLHCRV